MISYIDTSVLIKLLMDDEVGASADQRLWLDSDFVMCAEIGYAQARAALASARRGGRIDGNGLSIAKAELNTLWTQVDVVPVTTDSTSPTPSNLASKPERIQPAAVVTVTETA